MGRIKELKTLVAPLRADTVSGAAALARMASEVVGKAARRLPATSLEELRSGLGELFAELLEAQPAMAPLVSLARDVLEATQHATDIDEARRVAVQAAFAFRADLGARAAALASRGAALLPTDGTVLTVSSSSSVREVLLHDSAPEGLRVICLESRPLNEGRLLAERLSGAGVHVVYAVDAAAAGLVDGSAMVLLGADSIGDAGVVNKIGSAAVAERAHRLGVPVHVIADATKILPKGFPQPVDDDRPAGEVWRAPPGVRVWNRYFEALPLDWVTSVVTDVGAFTPAALEEHRRGLGTPAALRR